jgi:hypothetical protein
MAAVDSAERGRRSAGRRLLLVGFGVVAVVLAAVAFGLWGPASGRTPAQVAAPPASTASSTGGAGTTTVLPAPTHVVSGIPVGYPDTVLGAVSAAAHYTQARDLLSPGLVVGQLKVMADPDPQQIGRLASTAISDSLNLRYSLDLDLGGQSDQADYITDQPRAYHLVQQSSGRVDVWLLTRRTTVVGGVQQEQAAYTVAVALIWTGGDWKLADRSLPTAPAAAAPDTPQATADGWTSLAYTTS